MERREKILNAALDLFASQGYHAVSTSKIAKRAEVSEGLIFRHFNNKQGLLTAVLDLGHERASDLYKPLLEMEDPKLILRKYIELPFTVAQEDYEFWKLQFKLKWELEISPEEGIEPILHKLIEVFTALNYHSPLEESRLLMHIIEGIAGGIIKSGLASQMPLKDFLLQKYRV